MTVLLSGCKCCPAACELHDGMIHQQAVMSYLSASRFVPCSWQAQGAFPECPRDTGPTMVGVPECM